MDQFTWFEGEHNFLRPGQTASLGSPALTVSFDRPKDSPWDEQKWFCMDIEVDQQSDVRSEVIFCPDDGGEPVTAAIELMPNIKVAYRVSLDELWSRRFFLPVFPGSYKGHLKGLPTDPGRIAKVIISIKPGLEFRGARLTRVYVADREPDFHAPEKPIIDEMGQLKTKDWPTKTKSVREMTERLRKEYDRAKTTEPKDRGLSRFGGYLCRRFEATGWFRLEHDGERWWLADPDGYAFFSHGVCYGTRMGEFGWFSGMEAFYEHPESPDDPMYRDAFTHPGLIAEYVKRHGKTARSGEWMFNPARANMIKVFGSDWWEAWRVITARRFRDWGFNTTGVGIVNFIDERCEDFLRLSELPYAVTLKRFPTTKHFIFRDLPDVFSDEYRENSRAFAENELSRYADDPYLLGYFLHNEPECFFQENCCFAHELLVKEEPLESRKHFMNWLREKYGTLESFRRAWGLPLEDWQDLLSPLPRNTALSEEAWKDLREYEQVLIDAFCRIPADACRKVDPHHLCLGMRNSRVNEKTVMSGRNFDIFSFNCYQRSALDRIELASKVGKPLLIGEWHLGGQEIGLYRTALLSCMTQLDRAKACRRYIEEAAARPECVGAHYFEYNDQTVMGRFDGEHMAHGIIDCTNRPYPEMAKGISEVSDRLYGLHTGKISPFRDDTIRYMDPDASW